ncbi:Rix1 complex component [Pseudomassariella vexata]|uniref:Pre-rRNA-processing protein n=1 Tax=Pseudomassariella vexata TaxID=1141098 RepID=A0A1Y2E717_9PEZI|nr:Rix1 complex component [Pseudomassariella vexata]ORY67363.1 Rix1 complex component [Pseudomassariella vexata]
MGSSTRKKKEKKKDFQKPKLKVGKTKAKAANFTDTSFNSKAIVLHQQLAEEAPDSDARFRHNLSLTASRSDSQRRDALASLTSQLTSNLDIPIGTSTILHKLLPLMTDISGPVRSQLLKLLKALPAEEVKPDVEKLILYIRGAMSHISQDIKNDGLNYMEWLLDIAGDEVVVGAGCWIKPLKVFMSILGWASGPTTSATGKGKGGWTSAPRTTFGAQKHGQSYPRQILVLAKFLQHGFKPETSTFWTSNDWFNQFSRVPRTPNAFGYIGLFHAPRDEDGEIYRDREDRQKVFHKRFLEAVQNGVNMAKQEGGLAGRAAAVLDKVLKEGMADYEAPSRDYDADDGLWDGYIM